MAGTFKFAKTIWAVTYSLIAKTLDRPTGLASKETFQQAVLEAAEKYINSGRRFALLLIDLDNFKEINSRHGHLGGDRALKYVAGSLLTTLRTGNSLTDIAARNGGDEMGAILEIANPDYAPVPVGVSVANRFRTALERTSDGIKVTCSIGVCDFSVAEKSLRNSGREVTAEALAEEITRLADEASEAVKKAGKNGVACAYYKESGVIGYEVIRTRNQ
ncbi:GGDEF domain-containing protein [Candidatus Micrarchaeota archaeon]|nr:GGDEF domain-containing protein [Candidatus Micrarchaeota archaeon]